MSDNKKQRLTEEEQARRSNDEAIAAGEAQYRQSLLGDEA